MTAAYPYTLRTLNDNWFEDRLQAEGAASACGSIDEKRLRKVENEIAYIGERYDVLTRIARCPAKQSYASPDDGFRENKTLANIDFADPLSRKEFVRNPPAKAVLITTETIPEVCHDERRPIPGKSRGFGAVLDRYGPEHGQRFWNTAFEDAFGQTPAGTRLTRKERGMRTSASSPSLTSAGISVLDEANRAQGMKVGVLCGENYNPVADPSSATEVQRSWLYQKDPSIRNIHLGGKKSALSKSDNELSINLGEGQHAQTVANLESRGGKLFRVATNITKGKGQRYGVSIFQDE